ncbi:hypothetical protein VNI00_008395 [Paramarasmius palmivorus]|uniref:Transcription activator of gluconeogenesis ERT1 n=1 Tax=Paramarasmius palmivorus TaxID=297713 RepID=A0AAW0CYN3_9AGAR
MADSEQSTTLSTTTSPPMTIHFYPLNQSAYPVRQKRRQVKVACTSCQRACKKCDDARPCLRCVKYGISDECVDSQRKERRKGVKRGPYRKRSDAKARAGSSSGNTTTATESSQETSQPIDPYSVQDSSNVASPSSAPFVTTPLTYHGGIFSPFIQHPPSSSVQKLGDYSGYPMPHFYCTPPQPVYPQQDGTSSSYQQQQQPLYPTPYMAPYPHPYHASPYLIQPRPETQYSVPYHNTYPYYRVSPGS